MSSPNGGTPNGNAVSDLPTTNGANDTPNESSTVGQSAFDPRFDDFQWDESPFDASAAPKGRFAIETRAESTRIVTGGDAARRGEMNELRAGDVKSFVDGVSGEENTTLSGTLLERSGRGSRAVANKLETTVNGRLSTSAVGWQGAGMSGGEDAIILGGALTDTWTGGLLIVAAMSDDLSIGAGVRLTTPADMWLNYLTGMEERPGTAAADGIMIDMCGTLFEREYGAGNHAAGIALLSGTVYQTQRVGFRPLMRTATGVRNLIPGSGTPASEQPPPTPPPTPAGAGEGVLVATAVVGGAAGSVRGFDNFQDVGRVINSADEMENAASLRHAGDTASTLEDASSAARNLDEAPSLNPGRIGGADVPNGMGNPGRIEGAEMPNGMGNPGTVDGASPPNGMANAGEVPADDWVSPLSEMDLQRARLPDDFDSTDIMRQLDEMTGTWLQQIEWGQTEQLRQTNEEIGRRIDELTGLGRHAGEFDVSPLPPKGDRLRPINAPFLGDARTVRWPGVAADATDVRQLQLEGEIDALMALRGALEDNVDPSEALRAMAAQASELYGASDPRTLAYADTLLYYEQGLTVVTRSSHYQAELDMLMLVRSEVLAGRNPRVAVDSIMDGFEAGADTQRAQMIVDFLTGPAFDVTARVPEGMETTDLNAAWRAQAADLRREAMLMDTTSLAGVERASALTEAAGALDNAAFDLIAGNDPTNALLRAVGSIETRTFTDGAGGANEAAVLRMASMEYSTLLDQFRRSPMGETGLDLSGGVGRFAGSAEDVRGAADVADLEASPPYPGLPEEFSRDELRLTIDAPNYADIFPEGVPDEFRQLLDLPDQVADNTSAPARNWNLPSGNPGLLDVYEGPPVLAAIQPQLDDVGAGWRGGSDGAAALNDTASQTIGNYQVMDGASNAVLDMPVTISDDTQAVVDAKPLGATPENFDWNETIDVMNRQYYAFREDLNWRGTLAYGDAVNDLRADLYKGLKDLGGDSEAFKSADASQLYAEIQRLLARATDTNDADKARKIGAFLDAHESKAYNAFADLSERADEFESAARGGLHPLDLHVDQSKLLDWLRERMDDAMTRFAEAPDEAARGPISDEVTYFDQMVKAVEDGRNPATESGDQLAYLQGSPTQQSKFKAYLEFDKELTEVLSDPAFHKSATVMGDDTFAPVHFLRPELGNPPPTDNGMQTQLLISEVVEPEVPGAEVSGGNYPANRNTINENVGDNDFARAPEQQPEGIEHVDEAPQGPRSNLRDPNADPGRVDLSGSRIVNRGPDGENVPDEIMELWAQRMLDESNQQAAANQGGYADYMDEMAKLRSRTEQMEDAVALNPYASARVDAANQMWDAQRLRDTRPPSEWSRMPDLNGMRSWDSGARGRKSVRFGDASVLTVGADAEDVRKIRNQWRDLDAGNAVMPWWTGSGINRTTDPLNADEAVRHVPTPRTFDSRPGYPSKWRAGRQPGFGRLADSPGAFPFSTREQVIADLMQGQRVDAQHIDALQGTLNDAVRANEVRHKEWLDMSALMRSLRFGVVLGDSSRPFAQALDWRTLAKMLDMLDSAAKLA